MAVAEAKRGHIYVFDDGKNLIKRYVLVISNDTRATDRMVSIIMFGDSNLGHDVVKVTNDVIGVKYLHCGMLTYTKREFLIEEVGVLSSEDLQKVEHVISRELALNEHIEAELTFYKNAYRELLDKLVGACGDIEK